MKTPHSQKQLSKLDSHEPKRKSSIPSAGSAPLVVLPTTTEAETVAAVRAAGYVPVLCDDPSKVKIILASEDVVGGDMLMSAMNGLVEGGYTDPQTKFLKELYRRMQEREAAQSDESSDLRPINEKLCNSPGSGAAPKPATL